ncbi:MAG: hypothetical protein ACRBFS_05060 [Aureispira sp.]
MLLLKNTAFVLCTLVFFFFACKKEPTVEPTPVSTVSPYLHLAGIFEAERIRRGGLSDITFNDHESWKDTADVSVTISIENDSLKILGLCLKVDSINQTTFSYVDGMGSHGVTKLELRYADNYDSVYIKYNDPCGSAGNCSTINYKGKREMERLLPNSGMLYTLQVTQRSVSDDYGVITVNKDT